MAGGKGYELKATLSLTDNFSKKMDTASSALKSFESQVNAVARAVSNFENANKTMFGNIRSSSRNNPSAVFSQTNRALKESTQLTKDANKQYSDLTKGAYTFAQRERDQVKHNNKLKEMAHQESLRMSNAEILQQKKAKDQMNSITKKALATEKAQKRREQRSMSDWERKQNRSMSDWRAKEEERYSRRVSSKKETWARQDARREAKAYETSLRTAQADSQKASRRATDYIYGTNGGYGKFQYGLVPQTVKAAGSAALGVGAVGTGVAAYQGVDSVKKAMSFEQAIADVKAVTTGKDYQNWNKGLGSDIEGYITKKAIQTNFSQVEVAQVYKELLKAGRDNTEIMGDGSGKNGDLASALAVSNATDYDPIGSGNLMASMMNIYDKTGIVGRDGKLGKMNSVDMADLIAGTSNASLADPEDIVYAMQQSGSVTAGYGWTPDDNALAIALMSNLGIKGGNAGATIKVGMNKMLGTAQPDRDVLYKYGLTKNAAGDGNVLFDENQQLKSIDQVSNLIFNAFKDVGDKDRMAAFEEIAGERGMKFWEAMYNAGSDNNAMLNETRTQIRSKGAMEMQSDRNNTLEFRTQQFSELIGSTKQSFGKGFLSPFGQILDDLGEEIADAKPMFERWGKKAGESLSGWWGNVTNSPQWKKLQKTEGLGAKAKYLFDEAVNGLSTLWDSGVGDTVTSAIASGITFLFSEVLVPVAGKVLTAAWEAWQGFGEDHPMIKAIVEVAAMGWIVRKVSNIFLWISDIVTAFKTMGMLTQGVALSSTATSLLAGASQGVDKNGNTIVGGVDGNGKPNGKVSFMAKAVSFLGAVTMTIAAATIAWEAGKMIGNKLNEVIEDKKKKDEKEEQERLTNMANLYSKGENGTLKDSKGNTMASGSDQMKIAQQVGNIETDLKDWYGITDEEIKRVSLFVSQGKTAMAEHLNSTDAKEFETYWDVYRQKVRDDKKFNTADTSKPIERQPFHDYAEKQYQVVLKEEAAKQQAAAQKLITSARNVFVNFEQIGAKVTDRDKRISTNWVSVASQLIGGAPLPQANLSPLQTLLNQKLNNVATGIMSKVSNLFGGSGNKNINYGAYGQTEIKATPTPPKNPFLGGAGVPTFSSKAGGEYRVPNDGIRLVHKDETILPRGEARAYRNGQGQGSSVVISGNTFHVREEADVDKISRAIARDLLTIQGG